MVHSMVGELPLSRARWIGVTLAATILFFWLSSTSLLLMEGWNDLSIAGVIGWVLLRTFLYTGLFITAHDALHGTVCPQISWANTALGSACLMVYACFWFSDLKEKHIQHHEFPGRVSLDPDYHDGCSIGFWGWYAHFIRGYVTWRQLLLCALTFNFLVHFIGVSEVDLILFWIVPALLSTLQLFYFGTYLPHRDAERLDSRHRARSNNFPVWLSFLTCYHFGYHLEHHARPSVPWWLLPQARRETLTPA